MATDWNKLTEQQRAIVRAAIRQSPLVAFANAGLGKSMRMRNPDGILI